jgi:hypothetical protein
VTIDLLIWRPILKGIATLQEIETHYTLTDLLDAHEALDLQEEADAWARRQK